MKFLYNTVLGRLILNIMFKTGVLKLAEKWVKSSKSKRMIKRFIKKNNIDMSDFAGQEYDSYADFFMRKKEVTDMDLDENTFISPCDGLLSTVEINDDSVFEVKGIPYDLSELVPDADIASKFKNGLCLIFRLRASDYHHFCFIDDCVEKGVTLIPGVVHSVQPVALKRYPVFRQNKRFWHLLETKHFGDVMQIEVAAVIVGGVHYEVEKGPAKKGDEQGHFELCGSTILIMIDEETKNRIKFKDVMVKTIKHGEEYPVKYGKAIGYIK